jgi:hypothetical protein
MAVTIWVIWQMAISRKVGSVLFGWTRWGMGMRNQDTSLPRKGPAHVLTLGSVISQGSVATGHNSSTASSSTAWLAVGNSQGTVKAFDSATGDMKWQAPNCSEG